MYMIGGRARSEVGCLRVRMDGFAECSPNSSARDGASISRQVRSQILGTCVMNRSLNTQAPRSQLPFTSQLSHGSHVLFSGLLDHLSFTLAANTPNDDQIRSVRARVWTAISFDVKRPSPAARSLDRRVGRACRAPPRLEARNVASALYAQRTAN